MKLSFIVRLIIILSLISSIIYYIIGDPLGKFVCLNKPINKANILIVEGWLYKPDILFSAHKFREGSYQYIITTGTKSSTYFMLGSKSDLIFTINKPINKLEPHILGIRAYGSMVNTVSAKMEVFLNDSCIGSCFTTTYPRIYRFRFYHTDSVRTVKIWFVNDAVANNEDRNLYVASVAIDSQIYPVNDTSVVLKMQTPKDSSIYGMAPTNAINASQTLKHAGIPARKIIAISTLHTGFSRTYSTAKETMYKIDSLFPNKNLRLNVITGVLHSRRTYYAYKKNIKTGDEIGVITAPPVSPVVWNDRKRNLKEFFGILYNLFHL